MDIKAYVICKILWNAFKLEYVYSPELRLSKCLTLHRSDSILIDSDLEMHAELCRC
jgi:hypothetical protein